MKSKFTSAIMLCIIIAIICAFGLLGLIVWEEINSNFNTETVDVAENSNDYNYYEFDTSETQNTYEVPKTNSSSSTKEEKEEKEEEKSEQKEIENNNITVNKYFYKQLNGYSQIIYNALEKNKDNMKNGTYKIEFGNSFSNILIKEGGNDILGDYYQSAIEAFFYDTPDVFYVDPNKICLNIEEITKGSKKTFNVYLDNGEDTNYLIDEFKSEEQVEASIKKVEAVRNYIINHKTGDDYTDIKMIHDYLVDNIEYDESLSYDNIYNIYGALVNHKCVCEGYAKSLKYLLDALGIESTIVIGKGTNSENQSENHAWNYVKLGNTWYAIDSTWDDPIIIGGVATNEIKYKYFLKGLNTMGTNHYPSKKFTDDGMEFTYPNVSRSDY